MSKVIEFLKENPVQYLATVGRDGKAKCRPFMFIGEMEGKRWFCTNNTKDVYKDMLANPEIENSGCLFAGRNSEKRHYGCGRAGTAAAGDCGRKKGSQPVDSCKRRSGRKIKGQIKCSAKFFPELCWFRRIIIGSHASGFGLIARSAYKGSFHLCFVIYNLLVISFGSVMLALNIRHVPAYPAHHPRADCCDSLFYRTGLHRKNSVSSRYSQSLFAVLS